MKHESGGNSHAMNWNSNGSMDVGLWWVFPFLLSFWHHVDFTFSHNSFTGKLTPWTGVSATVALLLVALMTTCTAVRVCYINQMYTVPYNTILFLFHSQDGVRMGRKHLQVVVHLRRLWCLLNSKPVDITISTSFRWYGVKVLLNSVLCWKYYVRFVVVWRFMTYITWLVLVSCPINKQIEFDLWIICDVITHVFGIFRGFSCISL